MYWNPEQVSNYRDWWVTDPRWIGRLEPAESEALLGDRPWAFDEPNPPWGGDPNFVSVPALATVDLLWDEAEPLYDNVPRWAYLAARIPHRAWRPPSPGSGRHAG